MNFELRTGNAIKLFNMIKKKDRKIKSEISAYSGKSRV